MSGLLDNADDLQDNPFRSTPEPPGIDRQESSSTLSPSATSTSPAGVPTEPDSHHYEEHQPKSPDQEQYSQQHGSTNLHDSTSPFSPSSSSLQDPSGINSTSIFADNDHHSVSHLSNVYDIQQQQQQHEHQDIKRDPDDQSQHGDSYEEQQQPHQQTQHHTNNQSSASSVRSSVERRDAGYLRLRDDNSQRDTIQIVDAVKTNDGATSSYIAYVINSPYGTSRHRYSEFEALRSVLAKMYPTFIIPPIPPHHSIGDYAVKQSKAKEDANVIARRKRMLTIFLTRLACHPILGKDNVFLRFIQPSISWAEINHSAPVTQLPKNILRAPAENPFDIPEHLIPIYASLPVPSSSQPLIHPDQRFLDSEAFTSRFATHLATSTERINRRITKRWADLSADWADLGAAMNGFSLGEQQGLADGIEKVGQAIDGNYVHTNAMLQVWERVFSEHLAEYTQFSAIIKQLLKFRHNKHAQFEMVREVLDSKRAVLIDMERTEAEAQRLEMALDRAASRVKSLNLDGEVEHGSTSTAGAGATTSATTANETRIPSGDQTSKGSNNYEEHQQPHYEQQQQASSPSNNNNTLSQSTNSITSSSLATSPPRQATRASKNGGYGGFFDALSHTFQGVIDVDPESSRRNSITKTRETIDQLEAAVQVTHKDVRFASQTIQADLDRFQRQKVSDFKDMTLSFARLHQQWCSKNVEAWQDAQKEVAKIVEQI